MEWIKLRSVRSAWWTIALAVAAAAGIAVQASSGVTSTADVTRSAYRAGRSSARCWSAFWAC